MRQTVLFTSLNDQKNEVINISLSNKWNYCAWLNAFIYTNKNNICMVITALLFLMCY